MFAADSRVIVEGEGDDYGTFITYDNTTKVTRIGSRNAIAMMVGDDIGPINVVGLVSRCDLIDSDALTDEEIIERLAEHLTETTRKYYDPQETPSEDWKGAQLVVAMSSPNATVPRVWLVKLDGDRFVPRLQDKDTIILIGAPHDLNNLLLGAQGPFIKNLRERLSDELIAGAKSYVTESIQCSPSRG